MEASTLSRSFGGVRRPRRSLRFSRDEELVRLVRRGDEAAFEVIFDRHHRGILSFCRHMVSSKEEAEDAVQHTFAAAYRDLVNSDKPIQLKAWLYTIARNRCLSILRARREQVSIEDAEPATEGLSAEVQRRQDLRDMLADLARLPEDQRAALVLAELGALSHDEIGVTLGVRKDKVKALVFQARESLASSREARDADCTEIQEQLSVLRGGALRRTQLRRHVEVCPACAAFKAEVQRQRAAMACLLPVVPSVFLRDSVMAAVFGGGIAGGGGLIAGGGGGGLLAAAGAKGLAAKIATIAVVAGGATGGGLMAVDELSTAPADTPRESLAAVPEEEQSVRLVSTLRERAKRAAVQRRRDAAAGGSAQRAEPASGASGDVRPISNESGDRDKPGADKADRSDRKGKHRDVTPVAGVVPPAPVADPPTPPAAQTPAPTPTPARDEDGDDGVRDKRDKPKKPKKPKPSKKAQGPKVQVPVVATPQRAGDEDSDSDDDSNRGRGRRKNKPRATPPQPSPPYPSAEAEDDKRGRGHDIGKGGGHQNHGDDGQDDDGRGNDDGDKKDKLVTEIVPLPPVEIRDEALLALPLPPVPVDVEQSPGD